MTPLPVPASAIEVADPQAPVIPMRPAPKLPLPTPYMPAKALDDLPVAHYALELFLSSAMVESEELCLKSDPKKERLYVATGFGVIQAIKAMMSFEDADLLAAINHCKKSNSVASAHRRRVGGFATRLAGFVTGGTSGTSWVEGMTLVERHAELVYAETLFEKALLGILYSGDWLAFIKEALNLRATMNIYRDLLAYTIAADAKHEKGYDPALDAHFRSGVQLGAGTSQLVLSLMPARLISIIELFGVKGDRKMGLALLQQAGGWTTGKDGPEVGAEEEGVRRSICDMILLIFHLVLSSFTIDGVDVPLAETILQWNLKRYPEGVFFMFGQGRVCLRRGQPAESIEYHQRAMRAQTQYRNLHHISYWEMAIAHLAQYDVGASLACWRELEAEATWSKAVYTYGMAVCLLETARASRNDAQHAAAAQLLEKVPELRQRIAGKSIPLEKFVARKARKFKTQNGQLLLPVLELAYVFLAMQYAPRSVLRVKILPAILEARAELDKHEKDPSKYLGGGYWDDVCLERFLEGVCWRFLAYPEPDTVPEDTSSVPTADDSELSTEEAAKRAETAFKHVFTHGPRIELDHHIVYHAHYEYGRLLASRGDREGARKQLDLVASGKPLEVGASARKQGKYSMENALMMRTQAALEMLDVSNTQ